MTTTVSRVMVRVMSTADPIRLLILEEFRLRAADVDGAVARIVATAPNGIESPIPLLTSIDDRRDVATLRAVHAGETTEIDAVQHAALDSLVLSWAMPRHYGPRITENAQSTPSSFRLAVTESGSNAGSTAPVTLRQGSVASGTTRQAVGMIWIGVPVGSNAGLLVLLGGYDGPGLIGRDPPGWSLPMSRDLGVRIYENSRD
jgi:hypothetical protein